MWLCIGYSLFESDRAAAGLPAHLKLASQLAGQQLDKLQPGRSIPDRLQIETRPVVLDVQFKTALRSTKPTRI